MADSGTLLQIAIPIASFAVGFGTALFMQDRLHLRRLRSLAAVLLAETRRVRRELGGTDTHYGEIQIGAATPVTPTIHPWVHQAIVEFGGAEPEILGHFLDLDRRLNNQAVMIQNLRAARASEPTPGFPQDEPERPADDADEATLRVYIGERAEWRNRTRAAENAERRLAERVEQWEKTVDSGHASTVLLLKTLERSLLRFEQRIRNQLTLAMEPIDSSSDPDSH